jgi:ABC-type multidrug transport system fused ATPase/permease subunit
MPEGAWTPEMLRELRGIDLDWQKRLSESQRELDKTRAEYEDRLSTEREKNTTSRFSDMDRWLNERATAQQRAIDAALESQEKKVTDAFEAAKEGVATATTTLNERLKSLNDLRGNTLERETFEQFLKSYNDRHEALTAQIGEVREAVAVGPKLLQSRSDEARGASAGTDRQVNAHYQTQEPMTAKWMLVVGAIGVVVAAVVGFFSIIAVIVTVIALTGGFG